MDGYFRTGIRQGYHSQVRTRLRTTLMTGLIEWWLDEQPVHSNIPFRVPKAEMHRYNPSSFTFYCEFAGMDCHLATNAIFDGAGWIFYTFDGKLWGGPIGKNIGYTGYSIPLAGNRAVISFSGNQLSLMNEDHQQTFQLNEAESKTISLSESGLYMNGLGSSCGRITKKGNLRNAAYWIRPLKELPLEYPRYAVPLSKPIRS